MSTIRDVAKLAGVSPITVSRVINNTSYISADTRKRVKAAISQLGYVPNTLARSLRSRHTHTLALVLSDISNPFWTTVARGVEDVASEAGYNVILCNTDESEDKQDNYLRVLLQKQTDGILLVPVHPSIAAIKLIKKQGVPLVVLDRRIPAARVDIVRCDSDGGAYQLTRLLQALGHQRIAMLSGPQGVSTAEDRVAGYQRAMAEAGLPYRLETVYYGAFTQASGYERTTQLLNTTPRPTAIFAGNNFIAIGTMKALQDAGLRVPDDIALATFDDLPPGLVVDPFLTVAAQPAYEMGRRATQVLLSRLGGQPPKAFQEIVLPTEIITRGSSGPTVNHGVSLPSELACQT